MERGAVSKSHQGACVDELRRNKLNREYEDSAL